MKVEEQYFVSLPKESAHTGHPTGHCSGFSQRIHPLLIEQITDLVSAGITSLSAVKKLLHHYVRTTLAKELDIQLSTSNCVLFPTDIDIRNHIAKAKSALELSKLDQENLRLKIAKWKDSCVDTKFLFQPYIKADKSQKQDKRLNSGCSSLLLLPCNQGS